VLTAAFFGIPDMTADNTVTLDRHALGALRYVRASMEAAGVLTVPGIAGAAMGLIGCIAAAFASLPPLASHWLSIWLLAAIVAFCVGGALMLRRAGGARSTLIRAPVRKFLLCLCPALFAGAVLTYALYQAGITSLIPASWLLLYGCAVLAASTVTSATTMRLVAGMGATFVLAGIASLGISVRWHNVVLGLTFGGLHVLFGLLIARRGHGE
jgi:hypothetical protein